MPLRRIDLLALALAAGFTGEEARWMLSLEVDQRSSVEMTDQASVLPGSADARQPPSP